MLIDGLSTEGCYTGVYRCVNTEIKGSRGSLLEPHSRQPHTGGASMLDYYTRNGTIPRGLSGGLFQVDRGQEG